jgi:uncharacterized protein
MASADSLPIATPAELAVRREALLAILGSLPSPVVAFSGGVDSSYLAHAARQALGDAAVAVTALSPSVPEVQRQMARRIAAQVGIRHLEIETREMEDPGYRANALSRCYRCKSELYGRLQELAPRHGWGVILSGTNRDDLGDFRPGLGAAAERGVRHPLVEAELTKTDIRVLSREAGLPTWNAPASPCLSSRIPYGQEVTVEKLGQIEAAEQLLRTLGLTELRVRHHGDIARIEVPAEALPRLVTPEARERVVAGLRALGFRYVTLDLEGFRSGNLNG